MRITGGLYRGSKIKSPNGLDTRPTSDRVKEAIFSSISFKIPGSLVLDLFAGSGALGLDSISRGAAYAWLVEKDKEAFSCLVENVKKLDLTSKCKMVNNDWKKALLLAKKEEEVFDLIFLDPPYYGKYIEEAIVKIRDYGLLSQDGLIVAETSKKKPSHDFENQGLKIVKEALYGDTKILYFQKREV